MWHQGDKFFGVFAHSQVPGRALSWDSYGRSLTGGRDLAGFVAQVDGDRVSVIAADSTEVAGDPLPVSPTSPGPRPEPPQLPPMASIADLRPGWHQLDADILIDEAGNATLCEQLPDDEIGRAHV